MKTHSGKILWFCLIISLVLVFSSCASAKKAAVLTPITVQLRWTHQAQFAGFYAADQNGYYAEEGLAVKFLEGGPNMDYIAPVLDGKAQFSITNADSLILARAEGKPVKAVAVILRRSTGVYISMTSSGIVKPQDFVGKTIQTGATGLPRLRTMMTQVGISPDQYKVEDFTPDLKALYSGQVDVRNVSLTNEVLAAKAAGYQINIIYPDDFGVHFYGDTIFTTDNFISANPDLVLRFTRATLKGWVWAVENAASIGPMVLKYKPDADHALEIQKMTSSLPLVNTGDDHIGWMKADMWTGMEKTLRDQGLLTVPLDVTQAYTMQFLEGAYSK